RDFELFSRDLRENRVAALADFHRAGEHGYFPSAIHQNSGIRRGGRPRRLLDACEAFANLCTELGRLSFLAPFDGRGSLDKGFFEPHRVKLIAPVRNVAFDENIFHPDLNWVQLQTLGEFIHLLFASPRPLRYPIAAVGTRDGLAGVYRIAIDFNVS